MRIGQVAEAAGVSTKTVRYYESIGLVPEPGRTAAGYRDYDDEAIERLRFIRDAQSTGLTLTEIASILELKDAGHGSCAHTRALLDRHLADLDAQIARLRASRAELLTLFEGTAELDPARCTDPNRCQVIGSVRT